MTSFQAFISVILFFTTTAAMSLTRIPSPPRPSSRSCVKSCRFMICGFSRAIISNPRIPITRPICTRRNREIGQILSVGEAKVTLRRNRGYIRISRLRFMGTRPYPSGFIFPVRTELAFPNVSSLAVKFVPRPAMEHLQGACIRVPIKKWMEQGIERSGRHCVSFNVQVPMVMVELIWNSNDDLDLFVTDPNGAKVFFQGSGSNGRLLRDVGRRNCKNVKSIGGKETVVYYANEVVQRGRYFVSAEHTKNCMKGATRWELRVVVRGRLKRRIRGVSRLGESGVIPNSEISFFV